MKSQVLRTVMYNISGETAGEIWHWSLLGVKGLNLPAVLIRTPHCKLACAKGAVDIPIQLWIHLIRNISFKKSSCSKFSQLKHSRKSWSETKNEVSCCWPGSENLLTCSKKKQLELHNTRFSEFSEPRVYDSRESPQPFMLFFFKLESRLKNCGLNN